MITVADKDSCGYCKHIRPKKDGWIPCCDAFPDGIPHEYLFNHMDIAKIEECAPGFHFEPDIEEQRASGFFRNKEQKLT